MNQRQSQPSTPSGSRTRPASRSPSVASLSEVDDGAAMSDSPPNSREYLWRAGPPSTPATPTRAPRPNTNTTTTAADSPQPPPLPNRVITTPANPAIASALPADARPPSPALGPSRRTRRILFPRAPSNGLRTRPFSSVGGGTPGDSNAASTSSNNSPASSARSAVSSRALGVRTPRRRESPGGLPSWWLVGSVPFRQEIVVTARSVAGDGHAPLRTRGERGDGASVGDGVGTSGGLDDFVQFTNPVPESPFVLGGLAASSPASRSVANPVAAPAAGQAGSALVGSEGPSARYLREDSNVQTDGSGAVAAHGQLAWGGHGGAEWLTRDEVSQEEGEETPYPNPERLPRGPANHAPTTTRAVPPLPSPNAGTGIHPTSATTHPAHSFPRFEMPPTGISTDSGDRTDSATGSSNPRTSAQTASGSAAVLSDALIDPALLDPALFATIAAPPQQPQQQQQLTLGTDQPINQDSAPSSSETMEPSANHESTGNGQFYTYYLAQNGVGNSATHGAGTSHATANGSQAIVGNMQPTSNGMYNPANGLFIGSAQIHLNSYTNDPHFGLDNLAKNDNLSTIAQMGSNPRSEPTSGGYESFGDKGQDNDLECGEVDQSNNSSGDEDNDEDDEPTPHLPDIHPALIYDPLYNPAATYWTPLPRARTMNEYVPPAQQPQRINMYDPPLPAFDTDPSLPFAPWRVNQLPPFAPEPINRVITISARHLAAVGRLYPDATFLISRYPASTNYTTRIKGTALATSAALHFPMYTDPAHSRNAARGDPDDVDDDANPNNNNNNNNNSPSPSPDNEDDGPVYIASPPSARLAHRRRSLPPVHGALARLPREPAGDL
ncbi:predicted protein [Chaetomium globosum CBS 148.51]|uniref:Uncharacterized protein n=1 Tax=Chaetomium globosum (strain ATCC 6205 / CBS 148.51 / DSM 1962 / NBRC 6347 / NRRL 1970) TaxID=306901 RepID=Q2HHY9_CHAGB|nr:uncharacterized protein CHGG_00165 [Chaetomium globosum CBS 148.51]EAQ91930.1 predicted protein [Chaetomium globosum CBS 148.51]